MQLPPAAARPVVPVEGGLDSWRHDAAQNHVILTVIGLAVVLHSQPKGIVGRKRLNKVQVGGT